MGAKAKQKTGAWAKLLQERLPLYGHRNWIVIADAAYPLQARAGIETVATGGEQLDIVAHTLAAVARQRHVMANVYTDAELALVAEADAPGVTKYRQKLGALLAKYDAHTMPHDQVIARLDQAAATFNVLILKTTLAIPYTSVFLQLECGYWNADAEKRLRQGMKS